MTITLAYEASGRDDGALRMVRISSLYKKLSEKQLQTALAVASRLSPVPDFWKGEAAYDMANGRKFLPHSETVLRNAGAGGDEMSKFVLECFNLSGGD
jgi:hypothetical protein